MPHESGQVSDTSPRRLDFAGSLERLRNCPVVSDAELRANAERERLLERDQRMRDLIAGAGQRTAAARFENFTISDEYQKRVVGTLKEWVDTFDDRKRHGDGIVLYGPVGTGKDHLAFAAVGKAVFNYQVTAKWINGRELAGMIRDRISEERSERGLIESLESPGILVISDPLPPVGDLKEHQADMLYRICEARYAKNKITVATLNVADDDEADRRLGAATWDRLCHGAWKIKCLWGSYRKPSRNIEPSNGRK